MASHTEAEAGEPLFSIFMGNIEVGLSEKSEIDEVLEAEDFICCEKRLPIGSIALC